MCRGQYAQIASMLIKTANFDTGGYAVGVIIVGTRDELGRVRCATGKLEKGDLIRVGIRLTR
ncbi:Uncharacterised protein [Vibrio cholerae]|nr:Uncharacterised protein [Vibrio cholerae]